MDPRRGGAQAAAGRRPRPARFQGGRRLVEGREPAPPPSGDRLLSRPRSVFGTLPRSGLALAAGFLALGLFLLASVLFSVRQQGDDALLRHALEVEVDLGDLMSALLDAEVGQRGYLLTGESGFLAPYRASSARLDRVLARLGAAVRDDAGQAAAFAAIQELVGSKRAELATTIARHDAGDREAALALVREGSGRAIMDRIRTLVGAMDAEQDRQVDDRQARIRAVGLATSVSTVVSLALMGLVALAALSEARKRGRLARFLPAEISTRLADGDEGLRAGRTGPATVAFIDIRGSTTLAETLPAAAVTVLLTGFRTAVSEAAARHGGMVDKFIGDGALVVFGALDGDAGAPAAALAFAEDLLARLAAEAGHGTAIRAGIGIHHGDVFSGIVGTTDRQEFTVLGDTVNVASRIEAATKRFATDLLVSEAVLAAAGADRAAWQAVSAEPLRGRREPTRLYARRPAADPAAPEPERRGRDPCRGTVSAA